MSVTKASAFFEHIVYLDEKHKSYRGMDISVKKKFTAEMLRMKDGINYKIGIVHEKIYLAVLGIDHTTGNKGIIKSSINTDELRAILDDYIESYGYRRK